MNLLWLIFLLANALTFRSFNLDMTLTSCFVDFAVGWFGASGHTPQEVFSKLTVHELPPGDKPYLPCLIVNTGSNHLIMLVSYRGNKGDR